MTGGQRRELWRQERRIAPLAPRLAIADENGNAFLWDTRSGQRHALPRERNADVAYAKPRYGRQLAQHGGRLVRPRLGRPIRHHSSANEIISSANPHRNKIAGMDELAPNPETHRTPRGPRSDADWMNALRYYNYKKLSELGLAPGVLKADHEQIVARWHEPLPRWRPAHSEAEWQEIGLKVLVRVEELHSHGICHCDLHVGNIVVHDGVPLFIDMEFALASDPAGVCYDLAGPERSGIAVPDRHAIQANANRNGVWWDADNREVETFGRAFGSLAELSPLLARRRERGR